MDSDKLNVDVGISYAYCRICKNIISWENFPYYHSFHYFYNHIFKF